MRNKIVHTNNSLSAIFHILAFHRKRSRKKEKADALDTSKLYEIVIYSSNFSYKKRNNEILLISH